MTSWKIIEGTRIAAASLTGRSIESVTYWVLPDDEESFSVEDPNSSGCIQVVDFLIDDGETLRLTWVSSPLPSRPEAMYVLALGKANDVLADPLELVPIVATSSAIWSRSCRNSIASAKVMCLHGNPVGLSIDTGSDCAGLAIGYNLGDGFVPCDGDEIGVVDCGVFSEPDWRELTL